MEGVPAKEGVFWQFNCSLCSKGFFSYCVSSNIIVNPPLTHPVHVYSGTKKMVAENLYVI